MFNDADERLTESKQVEEEIMGFYKILLGSAASSLTCIDLVYKIIAKILTPRLKAVVADVVSEEQTSFIPGRQITDNIILATELIKGYTRKSISPRCMIKVDLRKAYDSLEWPFLHAKLHYLGFPLKFVDWIMACVTSVSYSILINGKPTPPFPAK